MKKNMKEEVRSILESKCVSFEGNTFKMTAKNFEEAKEQIEWMEKFVIGTNKKNDKLFAIAYKSKKSDKLFIIEIVEEKKSAAKKSKKSKVSMKTGMMKDSGMDFHKAEVEICVCEDTIGNMDVEELFNRFMDALSEEIGKEEILEDADVESKDFDFTKGKAVIAFPKIKGHSKDGYAMYKKCITAAKRVLKEAI